ncbi:hypothetical protein V8E53_010644 [Lactarius tabidus]
MNALFSLLLLASNIEGLASSWIVSWPESMHLISRISISHFLASPRWTLRNLADSSSGPKCRFRSSKLTSKFPRMIFPSPLPTPELLRTFEYKYRASS